MLVNGKWVADWQPVQANYEQGSFVREILPFRRGITRHSAPILTELQIAQPARQLDQIERATLIVEHFMSFRTVRSVWRYTLRQSRCG